MQKKIFIYVILILLYADYAEATTIREMTEEELIMESDIIIHGTVTAISSFTSENQAKAFTRININPIQCFLPEKGNSKCTEPSYEVIIPGGKLNGKYDQVVIGAPLFNQNDELVIFLKQNIRDISKPDSTKKQFLITGFSYGKWSVKTEKDLSGKTNKLAVRDLSSVTIANNNHLSQGKTIKIDFENFLKKIENLCLKLKKEKNI